MALKAEFPSQNQNQPRNIPVSPAPGNAEHGRISPTTRAYVELASRMTNVGTAIRKRGRTAKAVFAGALVYEFFADSVAIYTAGRYWLPSLGKGAVNALNNGLTTDGQTPGDTGTQIVDCIKKNTPPVEQNSFPTPGPVIPVDIFNSCGAEVQKAQTGK